MNSQKKSSALKNQFLFFALLFFTLINGNARAIPQPSSDAGGGFTCIEGTLNVSLDENCSNELSISMLVLGNTDGIDNSIITIDGQEINRITACGEYTYTVDLFVGDENVFSCTGIIRAEDNTPPVVVCPLNTNQGDITANIQTKMGALTGTGASLNPANYSCFSDLFNVTDGEHEYDLVTFTVSATDVFTFALETEWDNGVVALFQGDFNPNNPCQNIIGQSDDTNNQGNLLDPTHRLALPLRMDQSYTLLISNFDHESIGGWELTIATDGEAFVSGAGISDVEIVPITTTLICDDVPFLQIIGQETYVVQADGTLDSETMSQDLHDKLLVTGFPISITDNCSDILVTVSDVVHENGDCGDIVLTRTFQVADHHNSDCDVAANTFSCSQIITFRKPTLEDVVLPPFTAVFECDEDFPTDGEIGGEDDNPDPSVAGYPWILTAFGYVDLADDYCTIGASYSDEPRIDVCTGTYKLRREWNLIDWCNAGTSFSWDQFVKVGNYTGPVISIDISNNNGSDPTRIQISTSPFVCTANYAVHYATTETNCGASADDISNRLVTILHANGDFFWAGREFTNGQQTVVSFLEIGNYTATWCISDDCGNETCATWDLIVTDEIAPTAVCNNDLIISIGGGDVANGVEGTARLYASNVDDGSYDNCEIDRIVIRRNYFDRGPDMIHFTDDDTCHPSESQWSNWNDYVDFFCCDSGNAITVEMRVYDTSNNFNTCWFIIDVQDGLNPYCFVPEDISYSCTQLPFDVFELEDAYETDPESAHDLANNLFGQASGTDNCAADTIVEIAPVFNVNDCGWGNITRRFESWQWSPEGDVNGNGQLDRDEALISENECSQQIIITESHNYQIDFPVDLETDCVDIPDFGLDIQADGCDVLAVNIGEPERIDPTGGECYKLAITYDVINWCIWDGEFTGYAVPRENPYTPSSANPFEIVVDSTVRPIITANSDGLILDYTHPLHTRANPGGLLGQGPDVVCFAGGYLCQGRWNYTQLIWVYDTITPVISVGEFGGATEQCPNLEAGQFGDGIGSGTVMVSTPFTVLNECTFGLTVLSAEIDLFVVDENGNGLIDGDEFTAETGTDGNVIANINPIGDGHYLFEGIYPIIPNAMGDNVYHAISVLIEDACGNEVNEIIHFDVLDCKGPSPICINGLTVTLLPVEPNEDGTFPDVDGDGLPDQCAITALASDFEASPIYDCTGQGPELNGNRSRVTKYAIYSSFEIDDLATFIPDSAHSSTVFTYDEMAGEFVEVYIYAFDEDGNYEYCQTYVLLELHIDCSEMFNPNEGNFGSVNQQSELGNQNTIFELHQNTPNPFSDETLFSFTLPTDDEVTISLTDLTGRVIHTISGSYFAGYNTVSMRREMLGNVTGVINYTISTGAFIATKRMVIMK